MSSTQTQDIASALALAPTVISGLQTVAGDIASDTAAHKSVIQTGTDAFGAALTSLSAVATSGAVGHNDAANIETGISIAGEMAALAAEGEALVAKIRAMFAKW